MRTVENAHIRKIGDPILTTFWHAFQEKAIRFMVYSFVPFKKFHKPVSQQTASVPAGRDKALTTITEAIPTQ